MCAAPAFQDWMMPLRLLLMMASSEDSTMRGELRPTPSALLLADVAGDLRGADDIAAGIAHRRHRDRHIDGSAAFVQSSGLEMRDALTSTQRLQDQLLLRIAARAG